MPRGLNNWTYRDVANFLKKHGFHLADQLPGSHEAWLNEETKAIININKHAGRTFPPRTMDTMVRQSNIDKKIWRKWVMS
ncbi:MAG: type II toxin-antitoxin system HicA family toxin [bacterium]|nr:type II toxin-antitoxin system HicA family toxin [bacterium]MDZ4296476.1 type II toxin-antitoxin system HicA family toxin [Patescibacteria group bacterium]